MMLHGMGASNVKNFHMFRMGTAACWVYSGHLGS